MNIIQKNFKKIACFVSSFLMLIGVAFVAPFSVSAEDLPSPFVGVSANITCVDHYGTSVSVPSYNVGFTGSIDSDWSGSAYLDGRLYCQSLATTSDVCMVYRTQNSTGTNYHLGLTLPDLSVTLSNLSASYPSYRETISNSVSYIVEYVFTLDNSYIGYVDFQLGSTDKRSYVNGTSFSVSVVSTSTSPLTVSIVDYSLNLSPSSFGQFDLELGQFSLLNYFLLNGSSLSSSGTNAYVLQNVNLPSLSGKFVFTGNPGNSNGAFYSVVDTEYYVLLMRKMGNRIINTSTVTLIGSGSSNPTLVSDFNNQITFGNFRIEGFSYTVEENGYVAFNSSANANLFDYYVPLYFGTLENMPDYLRNALELNNSVDDSADNLQDKKDDFDDIMSQHNDIEQSIADDFDVAIQQIDNSFDLHDFGEDFLNSSQFVKTTFNRLTLNNPIGSAIFYSLLLGFALLIFGKSL